MLFHQLLPYHPSQFPQYLPTSLRWLGTCQIRPLSKRVQNKVLLQLSGGVDNTGWCYDWFSSPVGRWNRECSEVGEILTTAYQEFGGCTHRCAGKPKCREQDQASPRRRGCIRSGTAEEQLPESDDFRRVRARRWTPSCVRYMSRALSKVRGCRWEH